MPKNDNVDNNGTTGQQDSRRNRWNTLTIISIVIVIIIFTGFHIYSWEKNKQQSSELLQCKDKASTIELRVTKLEALINKNEKEIDYLKKREECNCFLNSAKLDESKVDLFEKATTIEPDDNERTTPTPSRSSIIAAGGEKNAAAPKSVIPETADDGSKQTAKSSPPNLKNGISPPDDQGKISSINGGPPNKTEPHTEKADGYHPRQLTNMKKMKGTDNGNALLN